MIDNRNNIVQYQYTSVAKKPLHVEVISPNRTTSRKLDYDRFELTSEDEAAIAARKRQLRKQRELRRRKQVFRQRVAMASLALTMGVSGVIGACNCFNKNKDKDIDIPSIVCEYVDENQNNIEEIEEIININENKDQEIQELLASNPKLQESYSNLTDALNRFSDELGEDGLELIKERVSELGNNRVNVIDVLKVLWLESRGRIYEPNDPNSIIASYTGEAFGPFQLTPDTVDFVNTYYRLKGTEGELDINNPYDNLDACILNLRFLHAKRGEDIESGINLPTGDNLNKAIIWSYHDGAWADKITSQASDYLDNYTALCAIDEYPEVIDYIVKNPC